MYVLFRLKLSYLCSLLLLLPFQFPAPFQFDSIYQSILMSPEGCENCAKFSSTADSGLGAFIFMQNTFISLRTEALTLVSLFFVSIVPMK